MEIVGINVVSHDVAGREVFRQMMEFVGILERKGRHNQ